MTLTKVIRIYLIPGNKTQALELWQKAVENGTTEQLLQTIVVKEEENGSSVLETVKKQILG